MVIDRHNLIPPHVNREQTPESAIDRRRFLFAGAGAAAGLVWGPGRSIEAAARTSDAFAQLDATALADLVRRGEIKPADLVDAAITRIDRLNPQLNAIVTPLFECARSEAAGFLPDGPFRGVPYAIKDAVDMSGTRKTAGSRLLAENISTTTTEIITRSLQAGLIVLGKTNMPEFALNGTTEPVLFGPTHNPWDLSRSAGGSSGGAAAGVASGLVPFAHASDGGGSIRIPASCCGLFGLKPSRGRMTGARASDSGVEHCVSRSVRDSVELFVWNQRKDRDAPLPAIDRPEGPCTRRLKIAFSTIGIGGNEAQPVVKAALERSAKLCESLGHHVEPARLSIDGEFFRHFMVAWGGGAQRAVQMAQSMGKDPEATLEPWTLHLAAHFRAQIPEAHARAAGYFAELTRKFADFFSSYDVTLTPVLDDEPPRLGYLGPGVPSGQLWERLVQYVSHTPAHNVAGTPAMSVPLGFSPSGLPIGSQFAARVGAERTLFELAFELEQARSSTLKWPDLR